MQDSSNDRRVTRRTAINSGLAVAAGSVAVLSNPSSVLGASPSSSAEITHWQSCLQQAFDVECMTHDGRKWTERLTLVQVKPLETDRFERPSNVRDQTVSLLFKTDRKGPLPSETYQFRHGQMGSFDLMISLTADDRFRSTTVYEAILN